MKSCQPILKNNSPSPQLPNLRINWINSWRHTRQNSHKSFLPPFYIQHHQLSKYFHLWRNEETPPHCSQWCISLIICFFLGKLSESQNPWQLLLFPEKIIDPLLQIWMSNMRGENPKTINTQKIIACWVSRWWFFTNPFEKYATLKLDHETPAFGAENSQKSLSCHHLLSYCWWKKSYTSWYDKYPIIGFHTSQVVQDFSHQQ